MKTDFRSLRFVTATIRILSAVVTAAICLNTGSLTFAQVSPAPFVPSPLSQYSVVDGVIDRLNNDPLNQGYRNAALDAETISTQVVDLKSTIRDYAAIKNCTLDKAFADIVSYLKISPLGVENSNPKSGTLGFYAIVEKDKYRLTAPQKFFHQLEDNLLCLKNGLRHVNIEIHFLHVPPAMAASLQPYLISGKYEAFSQPLPQSPPFATQASYQNAQNSGSESANGTYVVASQTITKSYPTFIGQMNDAGATKLLMTVKAHPKSEIAMAPKVKIMPGQTSTVSTASTRPYVVGVKEVEGGFTQSYQPIIQQVEDGVMLNLRVNGENGKLRLDGDLAFSEIANVSTFEYPNRNAAIPAKTSTPAHQVTVQIPEQRLNQIHWSTLIEDGNTLLIDPVFEQIAGVSPKNAKNANSKPGKAPEKPVGYRLLIMVKPTFVDAQPVETESGQTAPVQKK